MLWARPWSLSVTSLSLLRQNALDVVSVDEHLYPPTREDCPGCWISWRQGEAGKVEMTPSPSSALCSPPSHPLYSPLSPVWFPCGEQQKGLVPSILAHPHLTWFICVGFHSIYLCLFSLHHLSEGSMTLSTFGHLWKSPN